MPRNYRTKEVPAPGTAISIEESKKTEPVRYAFGYETPVSPPPVYDVGPFQSYGGIQTGPNVSDERNRILRSMNRNLEKVPEYDYNLTMPTKPESSNIPFEQNIEGRNAAGAGVQRDVSPNNYLQEALRRFMTRKGR